MHKHKHDTSQVTSTQNGQRITELGAAIIQRFIASIRPFGPTGGVWLATFLMVLWLVLLGIGSINLAQAIGPPVQGFLKIIGEGMLVLGSLVLLIGCVRAWWLMFRVIGVTNSARIIR